MFQLFLLQFNYKAKQNNELTDKTVERKRSYIANEIVANEYSKLGCLFLFLCKKYLRFATILRVLVYRFNYSFVKRSSHEMTNYSRHCYEYFPKSVDIDWRIILRLGDIFKQMSLLLDAWQKWWWYIFLEFPLIKRNASRITQSSAHPNVCSAEHSRRQYINVLTNLYCSRCEKIERNLIQLFWIHHILTSRGHHYIRLTQSNLKQRDQCNFFSFFLLSATGLKVWKLDSIEGNGTLT